METQTKTTKDAIALLLEGIRAASDAAEALVDERARGASVKLDMALTALEGASRRIGELCEALKQAGR